jgi:hypothetical protein
MNPPLVVEGSTLPSDHQQSSRNHKGRQPNHRLLVRSLMQHAAPEFQSPKRAVHRNEPAAPPGGVEHLKHAGVVLQQQFRDLRRRVQTARAQHALTDHPQQTSVRNNSSLPTKAAIALPTSKDGENDEGTGHRPLKLTPKKQSSSPIPSHTIKIKLQDNAHLAMPESLPKAVCLWINACHQLITGPEMHRVLTSTGAVYFHCVSLCIKTITLPITLPIHVGCTAVQTIASVVDGIIVKTTAAIENSTPLPQQSSGQGSEEQHSGILGSIVSLPGTFLCMTGQMAISVIAPVLGIQMHDCNKESNSCRQSTGVSSSPEKLVYDAFSPACEDTHLSSVDFLDRLRLDYICKVGDEKILPCRKLFQEEAKVDLPRVEQSQFLLRVNDLNVVRPMDDSNIFYFDISPTAMETQSNQELITMALDNFVQGAFALLSSHPICRIVGCAVVLPTQLVRWHPEGATKRILREMDQASGTNPANLNDDVLIWSGRFQHDVDTGYGRKHGFFLAQGLIPMSPDCFVKLLWDNTRTSEYNNFCLGRFTLYGISRDVDDDNDFLSGATSTASKVIQSEMRVPFAGITVKAVCLMHVRSLPTGDGFMICSRTLDVGPVGIHTTASQLREAVAPAKNEILWGVNVLRSLRNDPNHTQLTSLSQVGSGVPSFLAQKIGLMGIADFFKNVRHVAERNVQSSRA